jgi:hypothetical protein
MNKTKSMVIRIQPTPYAELCELANAQGLTLSAYVRKMMFMQYPHLPIMEDVREILEAANHLITTTASGRTSADPGEYAKYLAAAVQRLEEGVRDLKAGQAEAARIPEQWQQSLAALEGIAQTLQEGLKGHLDAAAELMALLKSGGYPGGRL